jgi:amino acid adenylation domain-containing protein
MPAKQAWSWDDRFTPPSRGYTIHEMFNTCVREQPAAIAVRSGERTFTYSELAAASGHYAAGLQDLGAGPGHIIPVILDRTPEFLAVLLAILRCGAAYMVLDAKWPPGRLLDVMRMLDTPVIVTSDDRSWGRPVFHPGDVFGIVAAGLARMPEEVEVSPEDPCVVFFTTGTTGAAKGVVTAHRSHVRLFDQWSFAPRGSGVVMPQAMSATWDAFDVDGWAVLLCGGTVILVDDAATLLERLEDLVANHSVNTVWLPTAMFHALIDSRIDAFAGLRTVGVGGERLSPANVRRFLQRHPEIALYNFYGPVECTAAVTMWRVSVADCAGGAQVPLGRALGSTGIHVLDGDGLPCVIGQTGEICVSGPAVALGYLGDDKLTTERFARRTVDGSLRTVYRTGDHGHLDSNGILHFDGRMDRQVKVRGHRIEIEALEREVGLVAGVGSCVVVPLYGTDGLCEALCLFYASIREPGAIGSMLSETQLRRALLDRVPSYMVPAYIYRMDVLPTVQDRKVDQAALAALARSLRTASGSGDAPVGEMESALAGMFRDLLGITAVPRDVSFFMLGGNSLNAAQLAMFIEERHGVRIKLSQIFSSPTVSDLALLVSGASAGRPLRQARRANWCPIELCGRRFPHQW